MSVKFATVRFSLVQQQDVLGADEDQCWASLCEDELPPTFHSYVLLTYVSIGWKGGARVRVKNMPPQRAFKYLNKLLDGGWIDAEEYHRIWGATLQILMKNRGLVRDIPFIRTVSEDLIGEASSLLGRDPSRVSP